MIAALSVLPYARCVVISTSPLKNKFITNSDNPGRVRSRSGRLQLSFRAADGLGSSYDAGPAYHHSTDGN
jgi:hypothetical protein